MSHQLINLSAVPKSDSESEFSPDLTHKSAPSEPKVQSSKSLEPQEATTDQPPDHPPPVPATSPIFALGQAVDFSQIKLVGSQLAELSKQNQGLEIAVKNLSKSYHNLSCKYKLLTEAHEHLKWQCSQYHKQKQAIENSLIELAHENDKLRAEVQYWRSVIGQIKSIIG